MKLSIMNNKFLNRMKQITLFILILFIFISYPSSGSISLKIDDIDLKSEYPTGKIYLTLNINKAEEELFQIYEDGSKINDVKIKNLSSSDNDVYVVLSIDSSKSLNNKQLNSLKSASKKILNSFNDKIALYKFNDQVIKLSHFTEKKRNLQKNIDRIKRHGRKTKLYQSLHDSIELLNGTLNKRKAIIVFTDGKDEGSSIDYKDIIQSAKDSKIPIYVVSTKWSKNLKKMMIIAKETGGRVVYSSNHSDIAGLHKSIHSSTINKYLLKYQTNLKKDGIDHTLEVRFKEGDISDSKKIKIKSDPSIDTSFNIKKILSETTNILLGIIIFLLLLLFVIALFFIKKEKTKDRVIYKDRDNYKDNNKSNYKSNYKTDYKNNYKSHDKDKNKNKDNDAAYKMSKINAYYEKIKQFEEDKSLDDEFRVLSPLDPEFVYAKAWLIEKDGLNIGKKFPIHWDEVTIGRARENSIIVNDDDAVSLIHSRIRNIKNVYYLFDLVSDNGTFLNGKKLLRPKALYDWDEIKVGHTLFIFRGTNKSS